MSMDEITDVAFEQARAVLEKACSPLGVMASPEGYPHVWARDSAITALGLTLLPDKEECLRAALLTLAGQHSELTLVALKTKLFKSLIQRLQRRIDPSPVSFAVVGRRDSVHGAECPSRDNTDFAFRHGSGVAIRFHPDSNPVHTAATVPGGYVLHRPQPKTI